MEKLFERTGKRHIAELQEADARHEFSLALKASDNQEAAFQGIWRKTPFPEREYNRLSSNLICAGLGSIDELSASYELRTTLPDGFVGISYKYNDTGQSEGWMKSVLDESLHESRKKGPGEPIDNEKRTAQLLAADQGVVRAQVQATMQHLLIQVQDKVMTDKCILKGQELRVANWGNSSPNKPAASPELVEQPVWGIDCYTRRNIMICLSVEFDSETALEYVEKWLLPAVNACPESLAYDLTNAAKILEGLPLQEAGIEGSTYWCHSLLGRALMTKIKTSGPPWLSSVSYQLRRAAKTLGYDFFRVHPKGHGSIVLSPMIIANTLVTYYRGEVYPSWRWGEKMDAIEMTQERLGLRPNLPDFYNMALERPQADPRGYGLMIVDASRKSGHGSMLSHSCEPTCEVRMASLNGKLCLAMTTLRDIEQGEELTFDYNAITESLTEYSSAVCLCGFRKCRGSFLHFTTADCYQQVLNRNSPIAVRFANLVKGCMKQVMSAEDETILTNHGFGSAAFGAVSFNRYKLLGGMPSTARLHSVEYVPVWLRTYVADILRYIEYERRALPVALLCDHLDNFKVKPSKNFGEIKGKTKQSVQHKPKQAIRDKPENIFFYYCRQQRQHFTKILREKGELENVKGLELEQTVKKAIGNAWKALSEDMKASWKQRLQDDWKKTTEAGKNSLRARGATIVAEPERTTANEQRADTPTHGGKRKKMEKDDPLSTSKISFEAADAEGVSAMEQRIQQLTHALSRIGRVLDRHRQTALGSTAPSLEIFNQLHAPLAILSDEKVVRWMWTDIGGPVQSLMHSIEIEKCARPELKKALGEVFTKYQVLSDFSLGHFNERKCAWSSQEARKLLVNALLKMRECILHDLRGMDNDIKRCRRDIVKKRKADRDSLEVQEMRAIVATVLQDLVNKVAGDKPTSLLAMPTIPVNSMKMQLEPQHSTPIEIITSPLVADNDSENKYPPILLVHRELARLMEEIRRRDGDKQRFIFDKDYINMRASPALEAYIADKAKLPTFYKNVTRALVPIKFRDCFEALRDVIRNRFRAGLPADDLMVEGPIYRLVKGDVSTVSPQKIRTVSLREQESAHVIADDVHKIEEAADDDIEPTHLYAEMEPWVEHFDDRWKLEAAADLLALYARTSTFFELIPYCPLKSTPIEVYARELGNAVPKSKIEVAHAKGIGSSEGVVLVATKAVEVKSLHLHISEDDINGIPSLANTKSVKKEDKGLCEPDDVITQVTVGYDGDFVLSQLLQWYNGGIGQKQGLPDMLGCVTLPDMSSCFEGNILRKGNKANSKTIYASELRQLLVKWLQDPRQRGSPLPDELRQVFTRSSQGLECHSNLILLGSPVLDLLVMGDDMNIKSTLDDLIDKATIELHTPKGKVASATERLQSTVDEGRPAQAVANWVQCENPNCLKWRKVPWHVDLDTLPEAFFCKDNLWNSASSSCDNPEDVWDENDTHVGSDGTEEVRDHITKIHVEKREAPTKVKKIVSKKVSAKSHAAKILVENQLNDTSSQVEQSPTASAPTLSEELSACSGEDLLCKDEELSSESSVTVVVAESPSLNRLPRKKPNLEQNINSGLLASFVIEPKREPSLDSIPRKLTETLPRKLTETLAQRPSALDEVPRRSLPCKVESLISNGNAVDVPRNAAVPQALKSHKSSEIVPEVLTTKVLPSPTKPSRWGPRLVNRDDERTECSRYDLYDFEPLAEWHEDKPHPLLGLRFLQRKW